MCMSLRKSVHAMVELATAARTPTMRCWKKLMDFAATIVGQVSSFHPVISPNWFIHSLTFIFFLTLNSPLILTRQLVQAAVGCHQVHHKRLVNDHFIVVINNWWFYFYYCCPFFHIFTYKNILNWGNYISLSPFYFHMLVIINVVQKWFLFAYLIGSCSHLNLRW